MSDIAFADTVQNASAQVLSFNLPTSPDRLLVADDSDLNDADTPVAEDMGGIGDVARITTTSGVALATGGESASVPPSPEFPVAVLGTLADPGSLCHYRRYRMAAGLPMEQTFQSCAEIQQAGFTGCPTRGSCVTPRGSEAETPEDMENWAAICKFNKLSQWVVARAFLDSQFRDGYACVGKIFYGYDKGIYRIVEEPELMQRLLQTFGYGMKVSDAQQMLKYIKYAARQSVDTFRPNARLVCFRNGTLNVETGELVPHSPTHRLISRIDAPYISSAECPRFRRFLDELFRDDPDREQRIAFLRQWMGYMLIPDPSFQKMLFLLGKGANGKSVLCKVIEAMVGRENVSHAMLNRLGRAAVRVELAGKLVNFSPDLPTQALKGDGYLKAIVSGDPMEAERKYSDSCTITPFCRLVIATNSMPDTPDRSDGFFRRLIILTFNRQFSPAEQDPGLLKALLEELDGIIAWAVEGLRELLSAGEFTTPPSSVAAVADYCSDVNTVQQFAEECLVRSSNDTGLSAKDLFGVFRQWCTAHGQSHGTSIGLGRALANLGFQSRKSSHTIWLVSLSSGATAYQTP